MGLSVPSSKKPTKKTKPESPAPNIGKTGKLCPSKLTDQVKKNLIAGHDEPDILEYLTTNEEAFNGRPLKEDEARLCVKAAWMLIEEGHSDDARRKRNLAEASLRMLYQKMLEVGDYAGALSAQKELNKLNKVYDEGPRQPQEKPQDPLPLYKAGAKWLLAQK